MTLVSLSVAAAGCVGGENVPDASPADVDAAAEDAAGGNVTLVKTELFEGTLTGAGAGVALGTGADFAPPSSAKAVVVEVEWDDSVPTLLGVRLNLCDGPCASDGSNYVETVSGATSPLRADVVVPASGDQSWSFYPDGASPGVAFHGAAYFFDADVPADWAPPAHEH